MKSFFTLMLVYFFSTSVYSQNEQEGTSLLNAEFIFSHSNYENGILRFSAFPNINFPINLLIGRNNPYWIETGINIRNKGIIYKDSITYKNRTISLGVPIKFHLPFKKPTIFVGAELDYALFFKNKIINNADKQKETDFLSKKINPFQPGITAEILLTKGMRLKASYYITNFFNNNYSDPVNNIKQYSGPSNIFYLSFVTGIYVVTTRPTIIRL
ncbi:hypothetical protein [Flavobacterium sp.]|uniref:hypothetical protein n=1 Tax=Flavobacterium sp. TaxID=239 RepID=UPI003D0E7F3A